MSKRAHPPSRSCRRRVHLRPKAACRKEATGRDLSAGAFKRCSPIRWRLAQLKPRAPSHGLSDEDLLTDDVDQTESSLLDLIRFHHQSLLVVSHQRKRSAHLVRCAEEN